MKKIVLLFSVIVTAAAFVIAAEPKESSKSADKETSKTTATKATAEHKMLAASDLKWADAPPGLPPGAKMAVLDGDPNKKGSFTVRLQAPAGYKIPAHTHPKAERVTVISGTLNLGMGDKLDEAATQAMEPGSFAVLPSGMTHFVANKGETIVQIHSEGPFEIKYVNPADDPRNAKK